MFQDDQGAFCTIDWQTRSQSLTFFSVPLVPELEGKGGRETLGTRWNRLGPFVFRSTKMDVSKQCSRASGRFV